tara:strand:+ start:71 stop:280 length:210 start_codon:yes stop_codon:yes gene_type:complete
MEKIQICDKLRFIQTDFCKNNNNTNFCKELEKKIKSENCPQCDTVEYKQYSVKNYPQIGCGIGFFVAKD